MNVVTVERAMVATLRGRPFVATATWQPSDPWAITLTFASGELWTFGRDALAEALGCKRGGPVMDRAAFDAAEIEVVHVNDDGDEAVEITHYHEQRQPVPLWFAAEGWREFLTDTVEVVAPGEERAYIEWRAEFAWMGAIA